MKQAVTWWKVIAAVVLIAGVILTVLSAQQQDQSMRHDLLIKTSIAKTGVPFETIAAMTGSPADLASPEYLALKAQLGQIRATDPGIRFVYVTGQRKDGTILIYADSELPSSPDYSPPGQEYTEAPAVLKEVFATGVMASEGPYTDRWGNWISAFIPVTDPATGRVIAVFGMDVDATYWNYTVLQASAAIISASFLLLVIIIASVIIQQRGRREQSRIELSEEKFSRRSMRILRSRPYPPSKKAGFLT
jgi:hypothetical protein